MGCAHAWGTYEGVIVKVYTVIEPTFFKGPCVV